MVLTGSRFRPHLSNAVPCDDRGLVLGSPVATRGNGKKLRDDLWIPAGLAEQPRVQQWSTKRLSLGRLGGWPTLECY